jgi:hypothetical protein
MGKCVVCGNDYDDSFEVRKKGQTFIFDSLECAITKLAPQCLHCGQKIVGHGVQVDTHIYCCAHCARQENEGSVNDRAASG